MVILSRFVALFVSLTQKVSLFQGCLMCEDDHTHVSAAAPFCVFFVLKKLYMYSTARR